MSNITNHPCRPRILFQEDVLLIRLAGEEPLAAAGMIVTGAWDNASVRSAIDKAEEPFDVIVLNGRLPDGRGIPLCAELRQQGIIAPVLMQSGDSYLEIYREAMGAGVTDYLEKPWTRAELVERVQLLLDMPPLRRRLRHTAAREAGSNTATVQSYCDDRIGSAIVHLTAVRPATGTLPKHVPGTADDDGKNVRPIALSEAQADELLVTLQAIRRHLTENANDEEEQVELRAKLLGFIREIVSWLGKRAEVATDETIKMFVRVALPAYLAHLAGLKVDLVQILAALGLKLGS